MDIIHYVKECVSSSRQSHISQIKSDNFYGNRTRIPSYQGSTLITCPIPLLRFLFFYTRVFSSVHYKLPIHSSSFRYVYKLSLSPNHILLLSRFNILLGVTVQTSNLLLHTSLFGVPVIRLLSYIFLKYQTTTTSLVNFVISVSIMTTHSQT